MIKISQQDMFPAPPPEDIGTAVKKETAKPIPHTAPKPTLQTGQTAAKPDTKHIDQEAVMQVQRGLIYLGDWLMTNGFQDLFKRSEIAYLIDKYLTKANSSQNISQLSNTLKSVGNVTKDKYTPDGIWGPKTWKGIGAVSHIATMMLSVLSSLGIEQNYYTNEDLKLLNELDTEPQKYIDNFNKLSSLIPFFVKSLSEFKFSDKDVLPILYKKQQSQQHISREQRANIPQDHEIVHPSVYITKELNDPKSNSIIINVGNIKNLSNFKKYLEDNNVTVGGQKSWEDKKLINKIIDHILSLLSSNKTLDLGPGY